MKLGFCSVCLNPTSLSKRFGPGNRSLIDVKGDLVYKLFVLKKEGHKPYLNVSCPLADIDMVHYQAFKKQLIEELGEEVDLSMCATHTHYSVLINADDAYLSFAVKGIADAYRDLECKEYADLRYDRIIEPFHEVGESRITGIKANIYLETLCLYDGEKRIATFITYNSHPTTLNFFEDYFSSVGPGLLQKKLEAANPGEFFSYFIGAAGDVSTRFARKNQEYGEVERLTDVVFDAVTRQLNEKRTPEKVEDIRFEELWLDVERKYLDISTLKLPEDASPREKETIAQAGEHKDREIKEEDLPKQVLFQRLSINDFSYIFTPFEMFSEYLDYVDLKHGIIVNCANDHVCYLSGLKNKYLSFELFGESIAYDSKVEITKLLERWSGKK